MTPTDILYLLVLGFIRTVKWIELQFLRIFSRWIIKKVVRFGESCGVIFHFTDDSYTNWSSVDEEKALSKCTKYDDLVHIRVHDKSCLLEVVNTANLCHANAFINRKWDTCKDEGDIAQFCKRFTENGVIEMYYNWWNKMWNDLEFEVFNLQTRSRAAQVAIEHYDLGNDLFEAMLDPWLQYSCGYWATAKSLNEAQVNKMELIAKKLNLKPGMRVLDIGCGWGMLCKYLAERHGAQCVGVTLSKEQAEYARQACKGLSVEIKLEDYRELKGTFDRIVSVGMFEHVGVKNHKEYFTVANRHLKDDGIFLCHTIGTNHKSIPRTEPFIVTIFPNGCLPKIGDVTKATEGLFVVEDWHNFGLDYAKTLASWRINFKESWPMLKSKGKFEERFYRTWIYYLTFCEGVFLARRTQLWQIVLSKDGLKEPYRAAR